MTRPLPKESHDHSVLLKRARSLAKKAETFVLFSTGSILETTVGRIAVEDLCAGDVVLDDTGQGRTVIKIQPPLQRSHDAPAQMRGTHNYSRFDRVRFVRGAQSDSVYQVFFAAKKIEFIRPWTQTEQSDDVPDDVMAKLWRFTRPLRPPLKPAEVVFATRRTADVQTP